MLSREAEKGEAGRGEVTELGNGVTGHPVHNNKAGVTGLLNMSPLFQEVSLCLLGATKPLAEETPFIPKICPPLGQIGDGLAKGMN